MSDTIKCTGCGAENAEGALYCAKCGARIGGGKHHCGATIPAGALFCPSCGGAVGASEGPADMADREPRRKDRGIRWVRRDQEVAARIGPADLKGKLTSGLEVQPGTRALLFVGGRYVATLSPGRHTIETLGQKLTAAVALSLNEGEPTAIVVDDGELGLDFEVGKLHAADHHNVVLHAQASLRLAEPELFIANLFRDANRFTLDDLSEFLGREVDRSVRELVAKQRAEDLFTGRASADIEMELLSRWRATLDRTGFTLNRFRVLDFELPGFEAAEDVRARMADASAIFDPKLAELQLGTEWKRRHGEALIDSAVVGADLAVEAQERLGESELEGVRREADRLGRKNPVWERLLQERNLIELTTHHSSPAELEKLKRRVDSENALDAAEWLKIVAAATVGADYLAKTLMLNAQADYDELGEKRDYQLKLTKLLGQRSLNQAQLETEIAELRAVHESRLRQSAEEFDQKLSQAERDFGFEERRERSTADLQHLRLERLEGLRQLAKDKEATRKLQEQITAAEMDVKRTQAESDIFVGMNADQILSVAVARDPGKAGEIAAAIRAMKSGEASEIQKEMYERMVKEVKEITARSQDLDHAKFVSSVDADARHRARFEALGEQEKDRVQAVATAGLTADDKKQMHWGFCELHQMKHVLSSGCPICARDRSSG